MTRRNPYDVLGVARSADDETIKKAFRRKAKELHPDRNRSDPKAQDCFAELNTAYEILGDAQKKAQYDAGQIDAEGKPRFDGFAGASPFGRGAGAGAPGAGPSAEEIFRSFGFGRGGGAESDMFADLIRGMRGGAGEAPGPGAGAGAGPAPPRGATPDLEAELAVTLEEAAAGASKRVMLPNGREGEVAVPRGVESGQTIRLKGKGRAGTLGRADGDLLLRVKLLPHERFRLDGRDLRAGVEVPLATAVLGGSVRVPTLTGAIELTIPPGTDGGRVFRLKGKGFPAKDGAGDLLLRADIVLPRGDAELEALMRKRKSRGAG
jgi:DnaJ-class molecular chaperone